MGVLASDGVRVVIGDDLGMVAALVCRWYGAVDVVVKGGGVFSATGKGAVSVVLAGVVVDGGALGAHAGWPGDDPCCRSCGCCWCCCCCSCFCSCCCW